MSTPRGNGLPMNATALRAEYVSNSVDAMSPGRMVVALYQRLLVDLERGQQAIEDGDVAMAHDSIMHAQSIVSALHDSLDARQWPPAHNLKAIYVFLLFELVTANVEKDAARVAKCRELVVPLRDAWISAAGIVPSPAGDLP